MGRPRLRPARPTKVGACLKRLREHMGLTQHALAARSGVSRATIAALELGRYQGAMARTVEKLATALGVPPGVLHDNDTTGVAPSGDLDAALKRFASSVWFKAVAVTDAELAWLSETPATLWNNLAPSNQALAELLAWRRRHLLGA